MHGHALQVTRKVTEVLDRHDIPYTINEGGKHPHIEYKHNNQTHRVPLHSKRISGGFYDIIPTVRRVERIVAKQEQETDMSATATIVQIHSPTLSTDALRDFDGEPRIDDMTLSRLLGYARDKSGMRALASRRMDELETYGPVVIETVRPTIRGGRPGQIYFFNEAQALLMTMFSEAPASSSIRRRLIEVFLDWKKTNATPALPAPQSEPEILANDAAIEQITRAVVAAIGGREIAYQESSQVSHQAMGERGVMAPEVRKMLEDLFYWQRDKLNGIHNEIARRDETIRLMGRELDEQGRRIADLSGQVENARRTIIGVVASQRPKVLVEPPRQVELVLPIPEPVIEVVAEVAPEPVPVPIERVTLQQVYDMIGIDRRRISIDRALAGFVRMGLTHYHERMGVEIEKEVAHETRAGKVTHINHFAKDLVMPWYEERGRDGLKKHLKKMFRTKTLAGIA